MVGADPGREPRSTLPNPCRPRMPAGVASPSTSWPPPGGPGHAQAEARAAAVGISHTIKPEPGAPSLLEEFRVPSAVLAHRRPGAGHRRHRGRPGQGPSNAPPACRETSAPARRSSPGRPARRRPGRPTRAPSWRRRRVLAEQTLRGCPVASTPRRHARRIDPHPGPPGPGGAADEPHDPHRARPAPRGLRAGTVDILVGTHALLTEEVAFASLGVVVVDEQHRFGVEQRDILRGKGRYSGGADPDVLVMTATPIPRTAAMTMYGDLDVTVLDELPPGRTPVQDDLGQGDRWRWRAPGTRCGRKWQPGGRPTSCAPLSRTRSGSRPARATQERQRLARDDLPGLRLGLLHGQMPAREKESVMAEFRDGRSTFWWPPRSSRSVWTSPLPR